jgi:hypothetical protein
LTVLEGDTLVTNEVDQLSAVVTRKFTEDGMIMV